MEKAKIDRINELARKSKTQGLTNEERIEQQKLREDYIAGFRENLRTTLDHIVIVDKNGNKSNLKKKTKPLQ